MVSLSTDKIDLRHSGMGIVSYKKEYHHYLRDHCSYDDEEGKSTAKRYGFKYQGTGTLQSYYFDSNNIYIPKYRVNEFAKYFDLDVLESKKDPKKILYTEFIAELWGDKDKCLEKMMKATQDSITFSAPPAYGKTLVAMKYIYRMCLPTIILVHRTDMVEQWGSEIFDKMGIEVGYKKGQKYVEKDSPIQIFTIQSILNSGRPEHVPDNGLIVVDECHHVPAEVWQRVFITLPHKYRLGISGTLPMGSRKEIYFDHFGTKIIKGEQGKIAEYRVMKLNMNLTVPQNMYMGYTRNEEGYYKHEVLSKLQTVLAGLETRNRILAHLIRVLYRKDYIIMFLSHRREHCQKLFSLLDSQIKPKSVIYIGATKKNDFESLRESVKTGRVKVILSTIQKSAEFVDIPQVEVLIVGTPQRGIKQMVGRLERYCEGAKDKILVDVVDTKIQTCQDLYEMRKKTYIYNRKTIKEIDHEELYKT